MKANIFVKDNLDATNVIKKLKELINITIVNEDPEYVFCFGGDGTFLDAINKYGYDAIYIPVNMGTLGFYSSWGEDNLETMFEDLKANNIVYAPTLKIELNNKKNESFYCLNEVTIINPINTQIASIFINDFEVEHFRGTGICVSTPTGSTAYNKSLGGAIISPQKNLFQLTHIAAINNVKYRNIGNSIILDDTEKLSFVAEYPDFHNSILTVDRLTYSLEDVTKIDVTFAQKKVKILVPFDNNFYSRVKKAFID